MFVNHGSFSRNVFFPLMALALVLAACGGQAPTGGTGEEATSAPETGGAGAEPTATDSQAAGGGTGACANPYYPVVDGATHTYSVTGLDQDFTYTETIADVTADGFTVNTSYSLEGDLQTTQAWGCQADGIVALEYSGGPAAALTTEGLQATYHTTSLTGVTIPANLSVGSSWSQDMGFDVDATISGGMSGTGSGTVSYTANAVGTESVTTPAGTFDAIKVEMPVSFDLSISLGGVSMPLSFTGTNTIWYASGVGIVKIEQSTDIAGTATIELQSYNIP